MAEPTPRPLRIAVLLCVCDSDATLAEDVVTTLCASASEHSLRFFIMDDASKTRAGERLADHCRRLGRKASCTRLPEPLGFRGCIQRTCEGLREVAHSQEPFDLVIKHDPDALVIRTDLGALLSAHCRADDTMWGIPFTMRGRDRVLLLADLMPFGFRRRRQGAKIDRKWEPRRLRPVWWFRAGVQALANGFRFRTPGGGFYIVAMPLVQRMVDRGFLARPRYERHGFLTTEEDIMAGMLVRAVGGRVVDLDTVSPRFGDLGISPTPDAKTLRKNGHFVVHPLKATPQGLACRRELLEAFAPPGSATGPG